MLSLGGVDHLTGGTKAEGRVTCDALLRLCNGEAVELTIDGGAEVVVQAGQAADRRRRDRTPHARRLRLGHHRHVRGAVARAGRRGGRRRRPHHRRGQRAPGGQGAGLARHRHPDQGPPLDARALFPGRRARARLGRHEYRGPADDPRPLACQERRAPGPDPADGVDHRRAIRLLRPRRRPRAAKGRPARRADTLGRPDRRELRTGAVHRAVHGRRRRQPARPA